MFDGRGAGADTHALISDGADTQVLTNDGVDAHALSDRDAGSGG